MMKRCGIYMEKKKPYLALVLVQLIYAGMALLSKAAIVKGMDPFVFVFYRQVFATIALFPFAFFLPSNKDALLSFTIICKIFLLSLFGITLSLNIYSFAMKYTSATFAAATTNTIPAITFVIAALLGMENISIWKWHGLAKVMGSVVGVCGAFVYAFVKGPPLCLINSCFGADQKETSELHNSREEWLKGSLLMLLANTVWSFWLIMQATVLKQYPAKLRLTTLQCFFSCIQSAIWAIYMQRNISSWKLGWDVNLLSVAYCGVIVTGFCYWVQLWAISKKGPVFTSMFTPLALIVTAIFSAFLWKEILHLGSVCGAIFLALGLYAMLWGKNRELLDAKETKQLHSDVKEETKLEVIILCTSPGINNHQIEQKK